MQKILRGLFFGFLLIFGFLLVSKFQVSAFDASSTGKLRDIPNLGKRFATTAALPTNTSSRASDFALKACEVHTKVINIRQKNIIRLATKMDDRLSDLATAVEKYYTTKLVPDGKTVSNYDSLVSDINAKHDALTPLIAKIQADTDNLSCEKGQQKTEFTTFRTDMQSLLSAFKSYRLSVIKLFQAVKASGGKEGAVSPTVTPTGEVSETPTATPTP